MKEAALALYLFFLSISWCLGQAGFSKEYRYKNTRNTEFFSIVNDNDTLVIHGLAIDGANGQGMLLTKIDTFGNVLLQQFYPDSLVSTPYIAEDGYDIDISRDGGYVTIGVANFVTSFVKLVHNGDLDFSREYPTNSDVLVPHYHKICSVDDGYFLGGEKQLQADSKSDVFISRLSETGDMLWEKRYGDFGVFELMGEMTVADPNTIIIGGWKTLDLTEGVYWHQPWFFCIDTLGDVKWEWLGEKDDKAGVVDDFVITPDGSIVFLNTFIDTIVHSGNTGFFRGRLVKLDSNRQEVWSTSVGQATFSFNDLSDLVTTEQGDFIATGKYAPNEDGGTGNALVNWTVKFSSEGEVLWERFDSTLWTPDRGVWNDPSGITLLSSGSIVICGTASRLLPPDSGNRGYVIKLDKHGCMEEGCELGPITRVNVPFDQNLEVLIYPNPATESTTVEFSGSGSVVLFDIQGRVRRTISDVIDQARLDLNDLAPATYFVRVVTDTGWTVRKLVVPR